MTNKPRYKAACLHGITLAFFLSNAALAQHSSLPNSSRTVYKCTVDGKVAYSDEPCVGAQTLRIELTRGLNKSTGRELTGNDVRREHFNEQISDAIKPLTGLNREQFALHSRRHGLMPEALTQCRRLDRNISMLEAQERGASLDKSVVQQSLFDLRKQYRVLRC